MANESERERRLSNLIETKETDTMYQRRAEQIKFRRVLNDFIVNRGDRL